MYLSSFHVASRNPKAVLLKFLTFASMVAVLCSSVLLPGDAYAAELPSPTAVAAPSNPIPTAANAWPMPGANPERTSWSPEEVPGQLHPVWYKPFEPYISQKVQVIAAYDMLYISTASGLYALDSDTGAEKWIYPTELPLGHSPTIVDGVAYVGGFDQYLHAIDAFTGAPLWQFKGGAGFQTNPLVVNGIAYVGNRDGVFYAVHTVGPKMGQLAWSYKTGGPVLFSAAYKNGTVYFASQDSYAYALNASTGDLVWKSEKLPGSGFRSWWPVVYRDKVIFSGSNNYRFTGLGPGPLNNSLDKDGAYPKNATDPRGTPIGPVGKEPGDWASGTVTINASRASRYLDQNPWRKTYHVLDIQTGQERETAPVLWTGTAGTGSHYPPVIGSDNVIYQQNSYLSDPYIPGGHVSGWKIGTSYISQITNDWGAVDEPHAYAAGGNLIYWQVCCDRQAGSIDISVPYSKDASARDWSYFSYNTGNGRSLEEMLGDYTAFYNPDTGINNTSPYSSYGRNGIYGNHGDTNPPIPYKNKVYLHRGNSIVAFAATKDPVTALPQAKTVAVNATGSESLDRSHPFSRTDLESTLQTELTKIIDAGHLRPGYHSHGIFDARSQFTCGDQLADYWHQSADTIQTLLMALPYLPDDMKNDILNYVTNEYQQYPPYKYNHIGWRDGAPRESFIMPPETAEAANANGPEQENYTLRNNDGWGRNPALFYALWKYAETVGNAADVYNASQSAFWTEFNRQPNDATLTKKPNMHNAYIAGYIGFLALEKVAGLDESSQVRQELNRLLKLRADTFTKESAYADYGKNSSGETYCRTLNIANNFMYLTPELADYLREHALQKVRDAINEYTRIAPYWFVSFAEEGFAENYTSTLYDSHSIYMAKALILQEPGEKLVNYLDVPGFARGDLFYIQKLVASIANYGATQPTDLETPNIYLPMLSGQKLVSAMANYVATQPTDLETPRIYIPMLSGDAGSEEAAVTWFGKVDDTVNYANVRVAYKSDALRVSLHIFDHWLWYDKSPEDSQFEDWDAVTLYLDRSSNPSSSLSSNSHRFVVQLKQWQDDSLYQKAYAGNNGAWTPAPTAFTSTSGWRGTGLNGATARGWSVRFDIPFSSLGLTGTPSSSQVWKMALTLHDRDDAAGSAIPNQTWPSNMVDSNPATWGDVHFGMPSYNSASIAPEGSTTIRQGLDGATVIDAAVGGHSVCGEAFAPSFFEGWGDANYAGYEQVNIQNQWDVADWPCYSKYYVTFPLDGLPNKKTILSAKLRMTQFGNAGGPEWDPPVQPSLLQILRVADDWSENSITWNNAPLPMENVSTAWSYPHDNSKSYGETVEWDVSRVVAEAYQNRQPLRLAIYSADTAYHSGKYFWSSDTGDWNAESRPTLEVTWGQGSTGVIDPEPHEPVRTYLPLLNG